MLVDIPMKDGTIMIFEIQMETAKIISELNQPLGCYFDTSHGVEIPITQLLQSRVRNKGILNAAVLMQQAGQGLLEKRQPISIQPLPETDKYVVVDGNSTTTIARAAGWTSIWCKIDNESA